MSQKRKYRKSNARKQHHKFSSKAITFQPRFPDFIGFPSVTWTQQFNRYKQHNKFKQLPHQEEDQMEET